MDLETKFKEIRDKEKTQWENRALSQFIEIIRKNVNSTLIQANLRAEWYDYINKNPATNKKDYSDFEETLDNAFDNEVSLKIAKSVFLPFETPPSSPMYGGRRHRRKRTRRVRRRTRRGRARSVRRR